MHPATQWRCLHNKAYTRPPAAQHYDYDVKEAWVISEAHKYLHRDQKIAKEQGRGGGYPGVCRRRVKPCSKQTHKRRDLSFDESCTNKGHNCSPTSPAESCCPDPGAAASAFSYKSPQSTSPAEPYCPDPGAAASTCSYKSPQGTGLETHVADNRQRIAAESKRLEEMLTTKDYPVPERFCDQINWAAKAGLIDGKRAQELRQLISPLNVLQLSNGESVRYVDAKPTSSLPTTL